MEMKLLNLMQDGEVISQVYEGAWLKLPDGRTVAPAQDGWTLDDYSLSVAETPPISKEQQVMSRRIAYMDEADPLFFMVQRGEATMDEWLAKIAEIKALYPYPVE
jgi:hypothetical protein